MITGPQHAFTLRSDLRFSCPQRNACLRRLVMFQTVSHPPRRKRLGKRVLGTK